MIGHGRLLGFGASSSSNFFATSDGRPPIAASRSAAPDPKSLRDARAEVPVCLPGRHSPPCRVHHRSARGGQRRRLCGIYWRSHVGQLEHERRVDFERWGNHDGIRMSAARRGGRDVLHLN